MERSWPLTGRDEELRAVAAAVRPGGAGIVVAGPAGVGKTRLVREALVLADRRAAVLWAQGSTAARTFPLGAFAGVLDVSSGDAAASVAHALTQLGREPVVLAVDDAHLLDDHSAIVLQRAALRHVAPVVITVRTGEPAPDPVTALWKDDHLPRIDLAPLDLMGTNGLVARVLGGPVESDSVRRLWTLTEGSPLFLRHLLAGEVSSGRLAATSGLWRWDDAPAISLELTSLLESQMGALASGVQDVLDLVALAEPVALMTLAALTSPDDLEQAEQRGLIRVDGAVGRLAHPLYGEVRRATMGTLRARRLRGRVAEALDADPDPIPRAVLALDSDLPPDPTLFLRAAERATRLYDLPLAERLSRAAAETGDPVARLVHAAALSWLSRGEEAEEELLALAGHAPPAFTAMAHLHRSGNLLWTMARPEEAREALAAAEAAGGAPLHVDAMALAVAAAASDLDPILRRGPELLRTELPDPLAAILVASAVTAAAAVTGRTDLLDEAAVVGGLTTDRVPDVIPGFGLVDLHVLGHRLVGTPARGLDAALRMQAAAADLPGPARLMGLVVAGHATLACGRVREALALLREAWAGLATSQHEFRFRCRTLLATAWALTGDTEHASPLLDDIAAGQHPAYGLLAPDDLLARAWGAAAEGSPTRATEHAVSAAHLARDLGAQAYEVLAWQTVAQLGAGDEALPRLTEVAGTGLRTQLAHAHARAVAEADGDALTELADAWEQLGDLVASGDAAAQAAEMYRHAGRGGPAHAAAARARATAERSGARTPALAAAIRPLPLSAREREIAELAARGLSNRAIAARLTVSVRTVEGHLYRAGQKLGVSERTALADILGIG